MIFLGGVFCLVNYDKSIFIYDCGCVISRPKDPSCRSYGTRWRVFLTSKCIKLKCRDCGRIHSFDLLKPGVQRIGFEGAEEMDKDGVVDEL